MRILILFLSYDGLVFSVVFGLIEGLVCPRQELRNRITLAR